MICPHYTPIPNLRNPKVKKASSRIAKKIRKTLSWVSQKRKKLSEGSVKWNKKVTPGDSIFAERLRKWEGTKKHIIFYVL